MNEKKLTELLALIVGAGDFDTMLEERGHTLGQVTVLEGRDGSPGVEVIIDGKTFQIAVGQI